MQTDILKKKYLEFFKEKDHKIIPSASLIPENDPTVLFTTAGMHPLVPYLLGEKHPLGNRIADVQKCIRTVDIDEVGDEVHLTFFEMLGNWSLGNYFKKEAIEFSYEFLTSKKWLGLDKNKLAVSCFKGDKDAPKDNESYKTWLNLGIPKERIVFLGKKGNWWGPAGEFGPCGPNTEMFYWIGEKKVPEKFDPGDKKWVEIWNDVFMEYNKTNKGYQQLKQKNVDTGMGVERTVMVLQAKKSVYEIETFVPIVEKVKEFAKEKDEKSIRIIVDHLRAAVFILGDDKGIPPSNLGQGYVLRRLIRNAIRHGKKLGVKDEFVNEVAKVIIGVYKEEYPELKRNKNFILGELKKEEEKFSKVLEKGLNQFNKLIKNKNLTGKDAFVLYSSFGFPLEMTEDLAKEHKIRIDKKEFEEEFMKHQKLSRTATKGVFGSGLADHSAKTRKLHTATHLLHEALRKILGSHVQQKGSNITSDRLRFDFSHNEKLTVEQIKKVEDLVNEKIKGGLEVIRKEMSPNEAKKSGALGFFEHKYGDKVSVYTIKGFSKEICTGPHAKNTRELGKFRILKEESVAAGIRRIKAVLE